MLHISNISDTPIKHPSDVLRKGQKIDVIILEIDPEAKKISLGLKYLGDLPSSLPEEDENEGDNQENL